MLPDQPRKPDSQSTVPPSAVTPSRAPREKPNRLISLGYVLGLLLIFIFSLLLLPTDTGLGKLLWSALSSAGH